MPAPTARPITQRPDEHQDAETMRMHSAWGQHDREADGEDECECNASEQHFTHELHVHAEDAKAQQSAQRVA